MLKLPQIAQNIEMLLGGFFDSTYNEHRGPIQIVHQIERVRSSRFFEDDEFYRLIAESEFKQGGSFNPLDRAIEIVDANTLGWRGTTIGRTPIGPVAIGRKTELAAAGRWCVDYLSLADLIWAVYLHIASGGSTTGRNVSVLDQFFQGQIAADGGDFHHNSEFSVNSLEGKTVLMMVEEAIKRLKAVS
jgi:hypothetical protein